MKNTNLLCPMHILFGSMDRTLERYERYSYAERHLMATDSETPQVFRAQPTYIPNMSYIVFHAFSL